MYIWANDSRRGIVNVPLKDNKPNGIKNLVSASKVKGVGLTWSPSYDDSGNPVKYQIFRGNALVAETTEAKYTAPGSLTEEYQYTVVPVDTNLNIGLSADAAPAYSMQMYYANASGDTYEIERRVNSGNDAYSIIASMEIGGVEYDYFTSDLTTRAHYIYFLRSSDDVIKTTDSNLTFEIDYLDNGTTNLTFVYNRIIGEGETNSVGNSRQSVIIPRTGTGEWKTAVIQVTNAALRKSDSSSKSDFGILIPNGTPAKSIAIKEVRVIKTSDYE